MSSARLSKSRFVSGWQCTRQLWWRVHDHDAPELVPDIVLEDLFDQGRQVGELAQREFPDGVLVDLPWDHPDRIAVTRAAIDAGAPAVFEATFNEGGVYVAVDVLARTSAGFTLVEVKSSTRLKDEHIADAAVQTWVVRSAGIPVTRVEIMHLDSDYTLESGTSLFTRADITAEVEQFMAAVPAMVADQLATLAGPVPAVEIGEHCWSVRECPFWDRCWPQDEHSVWTLHRAFKTAKLALIKQGVRSLVDLPPAHKLNTIQQRQLRSVRHAEMVVEPGLAAALEPFSGRLGFLDFETVSRAVPVWSEVGPWRHVVVQFSYHELQPDGTWRHEEFLAEGPHDPREELTDRLLAATANAGSIVMYSSYERARIRELAKWLPHRATLLGALDGKLIDLLPVIQNHVYHPAFRGSFGIKSVLEPLVGDTYSDLAIVDGMTASVEIARLLFVAHKVKNRDRTRRDLLAYCKQDTWAMVRLLDRLRELAEAERHPV